MATGARVSQEKIENMGKGRLFLSPLAKALKAYCQKGWGDEGFNELLEQLAAIYKKLVYNLATVEEFLHPKFIKALTQLKDQTFAENICEIARLFVKGQFETNSRRRSFHSQEFGFYGISMIYALRKCIRLYHYEQSIEEMLTMDCGYDSGYEYIVALELSRNNPYFMDTIREMIEGDNNVLLSREVIVGIIRSGNQEMLDLLLKLLMAAGSQEGLRQSILESADAGSLETFMAIYQVCMEQDLFRFSSAARALYTWTGLYVEKLEIAETRRIAELGFKCLSDPAFRDQCMDSAHPYEMYFAVWAMGCHEVNDTDVMARKLIDAKENYKKYLGWHFIYQVQNEKYKHNKAILHLDEEDLPVLACATDCLHYNHGACYVYSYRRTDYKAKTFTDPILPEKLSDRQDLFAKLKRVALMIGRKEVVITGHLFPWSKLVINQENARVMRCMFSLAAYDCNLELIDQLYELQDLMSVDLRKAFYVNLLDPDKYPKHRQYVWAGLKDRSIDNKMTAVEKLKNCKVTEEDVTKICDMLETKSGKIKKAVVNFLMPLEASLRSKAISNLLEGKEAQVQVAIELMIADSALAEKFQGQVEELKEKSQEKKYTDDTLILLNQLLPEQKGEEEKEETLLYGLIDRDAVQERLKQLKDRYPMDYLSEKQILALYPKTQEVEALLSKLYAVFERHADYEYEVEEWDGSRKMVLFGNPENQYWSHVKIPASMGNNSHLRNTGKARLSMLPFEAEFREALGDYMQDPVKLAMTVFSLKLNSNREYMQWIGPFLHKYDPKMVDKFWPTYKSMLHNLIDILELSLKDVDQDPAYRRLSQIYFSLCRELGPKKLGKDVKDGYYQAPAIDCYLFLSIRQMIARLKPGNEAFTNHFVNLYVMEREGNYEFGDHISGEGYLRAVQQGLISENEFFDWVLHENSDNRNQGVYFLSAIRASGNKNTMEKYPWLREAGPKFLDAVVRYEAKRGQAETPITKKLRYIKNIEGAEYFCLLLKALGKENFFRGYSWANDGTKAASLSSLLKKCWPAEGDSVDNLKELIRESSLKEKRLVEAAMYAPQWASYIEEITGWKGLKKAIWLFHAHVSERFSSEKETEVAIYSPITPQEFNDGVFDIAWFRESYEELGEKRFKQLYNNAKYITDGSNAHRRSQLYADASLGRLDIEALEKEILEKRNQERLRAYALIPVTEEELLHRYEFIQQYIKDSRQFGAQRRESEKRAGNAAIQNLAIASGYMDVNRMLWKLENEKNEEIKPLLLPQTVGDYELCLVIDQEGNPDLQITKGGKTLKSVPKALAKDELLLQLKQTVKELKDQKSRGRKTLENAMINRTSFGVSELGNVLASLTIGPMARKLVWKAGDFLGYPVSLFVTGEAAEESTFALVNCFGEIHELGKEEELSLAHPHHLFLSGQWSDYMHQAFEQEIVQPFKQIFREYYPMTEDEKQERNLSRRYAGYQVQPKQTVGLLKGRGWTVDYEEGLQKVCYSDNLIVRMYAQADWFSPADIEAPTLEVVEFFDRKTGKRIPIEDVNPVTFSEAMRDIDLVVSVAYVGGVEIETSHSTVQMRVALAKELVRLMKLKNVTFTDHHARIAGMLANYSVHMGSGLVHADTKGMIPILPVHSQHRGRIFLPFADEDPRTAEIMSKIILLAQDTRIKDPEILRMLR